MLTQPLLDKLSQLGLTGFRAALEEQLHSPHYADLSFEERLGLLVDIEATRRANTRLKRRTRTAKFPLPATMEDRDLSARRPQTGSGTATGPKRVGRPSSQSPGSGRDRGRQNLSGFCFRPGGLPG